MELDITVSKGTATVEAVRIVRESSRPSVTGDDLRRLPLGSLVERAVELAAWLHRGRGRLASTQFATVEEARQVSEAAKSAASRRRVTADRLQQVADAYVRLDGRVEEVAAELYVSRAQTYKLVAKAREAGLLGEEVDR
ncbi:MAG: hypothetical protein Q8M22_17465 [Actinomycetota bacterium]|nr:hypothetical protein [Actinomycetota bacterium]